MANFRLLYSPLFYQDLDEITDYILFKLKNEQAAKDLIIQTEIAITKRLVNPLSNPIYSSIKSRQYPYRRIFVNNYTIFYVVIEKVMIVRRMVYNRRDLDKIIF